MSLLFFGAFLAMLLAVLGCTNEKCGCKFFSSVTIQSDGPENLLVFEEPFLEIPLKDFLGAVHKKSHSSSSSPQKKGKKGVLGLEDSTSEAFISKTTALFLGPEASSFLHSFLESSEFVSCIFDYIRLKSMPNNTRNILQEPNYTVRFDGKPNFFSSVFNWFTFVPKNGKEYLVVVLSSKESENSFVFMGSGKDFWISDQVIRETTFNELFGLLFRKSQSFPAVQRQPSELAIVKKLMKIMDAEDFIAEANLHSTTSRCITPMERLYNSLVYTCKFFDPDADKEIVSFGFQCKFHEEQLTLFTFELSECSNSQNERSDSQDDNSQFEMYFAIKRSEITSEINGEKKDLFIGTEAFVLEREQIFPIFLADRYLPIIQKSDDEDEATHYFLSCDFIDSLISKIETYCQLFGLGTVDPEYEFLDLFIHNDAIALRFGHFEESFLFLVHEANDFFYLKENDDTSDDFVCELPYIFYEDESLDAGEHFLEEDIKYCYILKQGNEVKVWGMNSDGPISIHHLNTISCDDFELESSFESLQDILDKANFEQLFSFRDLMALFFRTVTGSMEINPVKLRFICDTNSNLGAQVIFDGVIRVATRKTTLLRFLSDNMSIKYFAVPGQENMGFLVNSKDNSAIAFAKFGDSVMNLTNKVDQFMSFEGGFFSFSAEESSDSISLIDVEAKEVGNWMLERLQRPALKFEFVPEQFNSDIVLKHFISLLPKLSFQDLYLFSRFVVDHLEQIFPSAMVTALMDGRLFEVSSKNGVFHFVEGKLTDLPLEKQDLYTGVPFYACDQSVYFSNEGVPRKVHIPATIESILAPSSLSLERITDVSRKCIGSWKVSPLKDTMAKLTSFQLQFVFGENLRNQILNLVHSRFTKVLQLLPKNLAHELSQEYKGEMEPTFEIADSFDLRNVLVKCQAQHQRLQALERLLKVNPAYNAIYQVNDSFWFIKNNVQDKNLCFNSQLNIFYTSNQAFGACKPIHKLFTGSATFSDHFNETLAQRCDDKVNLKCESSFSATIDQIKKQIETLVSMDAAVVEFLAVKVMANESQLLNLALLLSSSFQKDVAQSIEQLSGFDLSQSNFRLEHLEEQTYSLSIEGKTVLFHNGILWSLSGTEFIPTKVPNEFSLAATLRIIISNSDACRINFDDEWLAKTLKEWKSTSTFTASEIWIPFLEARLIQHLMAIVKRQSHSIKTELIPTFFNTIHQNYKRELWNTLNNSKIESRITKNCLPFDLAILNGYPIDSNCHLKVNVKKYTLGFDVLGQNYDFEIKPNAFVSVKFDEFLTGIRHTYSEEYYKRLIPRLEAFPNDLTVNFIKQNIQKPLIPLLIQQWSLEMKKELFPIIANLVIKEEPQLFNFFLLFSPLISNREGNNFKCAIKDKILIVDWALKATPSFLGFNPSLPITVLIAQHVNTIVSFLKFFEAMIHRDAHNEFTSEEQFFMDNLGKEHVPEYISRLPALRRTAMLTALKEYRLTQPQQFASFAALINGLRLEGLDWNLALNPGQSLSVQFGDSVTVQCPIKEKLGWRVWEVIEFFVRGAEKKPVKPVVAVEKAADWGAFSMLENQPQEKRRR